MTEPKIFTAGFKRPADSGYWKLSNGVTLDEMIQGINRLISLTTVEEIEIFITKIKLEEKGDKHG